MSKVKSVRPAIFLVKRTRGRVDAEVQGTVSEYIYLLSKWPKAELNDPIINYTIELVMQTAANGQCFHGEFCAADLQQVADELDKPMSFISAECRSALSAADECAALQNFDFDVEMDGSSALFTLTKRQGNARVRYMEVSLHEQRDNAAMLDALVALSQRIGPVPAGPPLPRMHAPRSEANEALQQCVRAQQQMERDMMTKFCVLLNSKKKKILELQKKCARQTERLRRMNISAETLATLQEQANENEAQYRANTQRMSPPYANQRRVPAMEDESDD